MILLPRILLFIKRFTPWWLLWMGHMSRAAREDMKRNLPSAGRTYFFRLRVQRFSIQLSESTLYFFSRHARQITTAAIYFYALTEITFIKYFDWAYGPSLSHLDITGIRRSRRSRSLESSFLGGNILLINKASTLHPLWRDGDVFFYQI